MLRSNHPCDNSDPLPSFGLPPGLTTFFLRLYGNLKRHLSYLNWVSPVPTTSTNGVVQGCSLSLIAINLNMAVWANMISQIPSIIACAFIDDAYIWVRLEHCHLLAKAIETTQWWDSLCGQALNNGKCKIWGDLPPKARQLVKATFPDMMLSHIIDVLGTQIQTTDLKSYGWPEQKTQKISRDIKNIASLPCSRIIHEHIIASKVIPQLCYAPHVNQIPKAALTRVQTKIAQALWKNRPAWRSKALVVGVLAKPHRVDPTTARAYNIFLDVLNFLKTTTQDNRELWLKQCNADLISPHSICASFYQACSILDISVTGGFYVSLWNSEYVSMLDFNRRDFKRVLQQACRQAMYKQATLAIRADIKQTDGIIDFDLTNVGASAASRTSHNSIPSTCFRDSVLVGCVVTNDRAAHARDEIPNTCRCCQHAKETFEHLATQCMELPTHISKPTTPENCGTNFDTLGIVEISKQDAGCRLSVSSTAQIPVVSWDESVETSQEHLWTDGSCDYSHLFFHTIAAFAVVDAAGRLRISGPVKHWALSAYAAELFAIIVGFACASKPVVIHCDCKSLVDQVHQMIRDSHIPSVWSHLSWWHFLFQLWTFRKSFVATPLATIWIPAHVAEDLPPELVSREIASRFNTTTWDILNNRQADYFAKKAVDSIRKLSKTDFDLLQQKSSNWQTFLADLNAFVSDARTVSPEDNQEVIGGNLQPQQSQNVKVLPHNIHGGRPISVCRDLLPRWIWSPNPDDFNWAPNFEVIPKPVCYANITEQDWSSASIFFQGLRWKLGDSCDTSFLELAAGAFHQGFNFEAGNTPAIISTLLKKFLNLASKVNLDQIHPGIIIRKCKSNGKTFPSGYINGGYPLLQPEALKLIAIPFLRGRDHRLSHWDSFANF